MVECGLRGGLIEEVGGVGGAGAARDGGRGGVDIFAGGRRGGMATCCFCGGWIGVGAVRFVGGEIVGMIGVRFCHAAEGARAGRDGGRGAVDIFAGDHGGGMATCCFCGVWIGVGAVGFFGGEIVGVMIGVRF